jgi:hypothetical protein
MTTTVEKDQEQKEEMAEYGSEVKNLNPSDYGCQILLEKTTLDRATRCAKNVRLFDLYYDMYGKGAVQKIDFGYGTVNPKLWGNKPKTEKKRK